MYLCVTIFYFFTQMNITSIFDWHMLLLICPLVAGIVIFAFLTWSDRQHDRRRTERNIL